MRSIRVAVGVSGGVDSAVSTYLLKKRGFDVVGVYMKNWDHQEEGTSHCSNTKDESDARSVCKKLEIPFETVNFVKEYWNEVFLNMLENYRNGRTVVPDIACNRSIKFHHLHEFAIKKFGADFVATGHYASTSNGDFQENPTDKRVDLLRGIDPIKDQSFFLCTLKQEQLRRAMFPLGNLTKPQSMGICFVGKRKNFESFMDQYIESRPGNIVLTNGKTIGEHKGLHHYTIGKRLPIQGSHLGYFVTEFDLEQNIVWTCEGSHHPSLFSDEFLIEEPEWISRNPIEENLKVDFRIQRTHPPIRCEIERRNGGFLAVKGANPLRAIAPGQLCFTLMWWALLAFSLVLGPLGALSQQTVPLVGRPSAERCFERPIACALSCIYGYLRSPLGTCLCSCAESPCAQLRCANDQICVVQQGEPVCVVIDTSFQHRTELLPQRSECPRLTGGVCALKCETDNDCGGRLICCHNGCGRECVTAVEPLGLHAVPQVNHGQGSSQHLTLSTPIHMQQPGRIGTVPIQVARPINKEIDNQIAVPSEGATPIVSVLPRRGPALPPSFPIQHSVAPAEPDSPEKLGECAEWIAGERNCTKECGNDNDCPGYNKCCRTACGRICSAPTKTTGCIHLASAIGRLPAKSLYKNYAPQCTLAGRFERIQCDETHCWCVNEEYGAELPGTRRTKGLHSIIMCLSPRSCDISCTNKCVHGHELDSDGCPLQSCQCKNICQHVRCSNSGDACQLVEPECLKPPCLPVPRCLLNPCQSGLPMTLSTGVTALCTLPSHCSESHFCHMVGYNGLGFCCEGMNTNEKEGNCPARVPQKGVTCVSECSVDADCKMGKCCFDGCGLRCTPGSFIPHPNKNIRPSFSPGSVSRYNKALFVSEVYRCGVSEQKHSSVCVDECVSNEDCLGMKVCCGQTCHKRCAYPDVTSSCFHWAVTAELYSLRDVRRCTSSGHFERTQCDDGGCFCVDQQNGKEVPGTRVPTDKEPNCLPDLVNCRLSECRAVCPLGYQLSPSGCPTCLCLNPCESVKCPQGFFCQVVPTTCILTDECPPQPRCIMNVCPSGDPFVSSTGMVESCGVEGGECPRHFFCHEVGLSTGGVCCPTPLPDIHTGLCPSVSPLLFDTSSRRCKKTCRSDGDCQSGGKCCYNGCSTECLEDVEKSGQCPNPSPKAAAACASTNRDGCQGDSSCPSIQKCCFDGCIKQCAYPSKAPACIQLKASMELIGHKDTVRCLPDGSFESIQCNSIYCWCASESGREIRGTRVGIALTPTCAVSRSCSPIFCPKTHNCPHGPLLDSNGCETCECNNPCRDINCPSESFCVPTLSECDHGLCPHLPRCITNPCPIGKPITDSHQFSPVTCRENNQCQNTETPSFCRVYTHQGGYCCPTPEPRSNPGSCPVVGISTDCARNCMYDDGCAPHEKCCFNGCGLSCIAALNSPISPLGVTVKIGACLPEEDHQLCPNNENEFKDECSVNEDCAGHSLCCVTACNKRRCTAPHVTTACIHARTSIISLLSSSSTDSSTSASPILFPPNCDSEGNFHQIQSYGGEKWCVDERGTEIQGTRSSRSVDCRHPRSCPVVSCDKNCPFGFRKNADGCEVCECIHPCNNVICKAGNVCRMVSVECTTKICPPVPKCVPNGCLQGFPLEHPHTGLLLTCNGIEKCPSGQYCRKTGWLGVGYCCPGTDPSADQLPSCPSLPEINSTNTDHCDGQCFSHSQCTSSSSLCCFNGCGISCLYNLPKNSSVIVSSQTEVHPVQVSSPDALLHSHSIVPLTVVRLPGKVGECRVHSSEENQDCESNCLRDSDCVGYEKCCPIGCGRQCSIPHLLPVCVRLLLSFESALSRMRDLLPPPVQCTPEGNWRQIQCDIRSRECWCIDTSSGIEIYGTRVTSEGPLPNCKLPRPCSTSCPDSTSCAYGVRLDNKGCPLQKCTCATPCDRLKCRLPGEICVLTTQQCMHGPCANMPKCVKEVCPRTSTPILRMGSPVICSPKDGCATGECLAIPGEESLGMCCLKAASVSSEEKKTYSQCPSSSLSSYEDESDECTAECSADNDCPGLLRCCSFGCNSACAAPYNSTSCINVRGGLQDLQRRGRRVDTSRIPLCQPGNGLYSPVQCDSSGVCWCVDVQTGIELDGTRKQSNNLLDSCTGPRVSCPTQCSECPFGVRRDVVGCPIKTCPCLDSCQGILCNDGEVCLPVQQPCTHNGCAAVPKCVRNPCGTSRPSVDSRSFSPFFCAQGNPCPIGFSCAQLQNADVSVCCSGDGNLSSPSLSPGGAPVTSTSEACPHGDPYTSEDGKLFECSVQLNGCPPSHYCATRPLKTKGVCCVAKRFVCHLPIASECSLSVPRFYYSPNNQTCLPFKYGGCGGNMNNFISLDQCFRFCEGVGFDVDTPIFSDDGRPTEQYQMGFSLRGPPITISDRFALQRELHSYLTSLFSLKDRELRDLTIREDGFVRFTLQSADAEDTATRIHEAVMARSLRVVVHDKEFTAEPSSWFAHHMAEPETSLAQSTYVFWVTANRSAILLAAGVMCATVFFVLLCACGFLLRNRDKNTTRQSSPSNFRSHSFSAENLRRQPIFPSHMSSATTVRLPSTATVHSNQYGHGRLRSPQETTLYY